MTAQAARSGREQEAIQASRRVDTTEAYQVLAALVRDGVCTFGTVRDDAGAIVDFVVDDVNGPASAMLGCVAADARGRLLSQLFPEDAAPGLVEACRRVVVDGTPFLRTGLWHDRIVDGRRLRTFLDWSAMRLGEGVLSCWRDVTADRVSLPAGPPVSLAPSADREGPARPHGHSLERFIESFGDSLFAGTVTGSTAPGRLLYVSRQVASLTGHEASEFLTDWSLWSRLVHPEDAPRVFADTRHAFETCGALERRYRLWSEQTRQWRSVVDTLVVLPGADGAPATFMGSVRDVTGRRFAEENLRRSERLYRTLAESSEDLIFVLDTDRRAVYVNRATATLVGRPVESLIGSRIDDVVPGQVAQIYRNRLEQLLAAGTPIHVEDEIVLGGRTLSLDTWMRVVQGETGELEGVLCVARDITARHEAEKALRESENRLALALEAASDGLWDWDLERGFVFRSPYWMKSMGYQPDAVRPDFEAWKSLVHPEDVESLVRTLEAHVSGRTPLFECEYRVRRADGEYRWTLSRGKVVAWSANGKPTRMMGTIADITSLKVAVDERARLIQALEQVTESIVITDVHGTIQYVNPTFERVTGYPAAEVLGRNPRMLKSGAHTEPFYEDLWATLTRGDIWRGTLVNRRKDGSLFDEEATISPVRNVAGEVMAYVAVKRDVSRERRLEAQLHAAQHLEAVGRLAGGVAHDFNNLLGVIQGYTEVLQATVDHDSSFRVELDEIARATVRAVSLTRQLLAHGRRQILQPRVVRLDALVRDAESMLRRLLGEDIELLVCSPEDLGMARVDPSQIDQILMNLAANARDAMADGGRLTVELSNVTLDEVYTSQHVAVTPGPFVLMAVTDTGAGIPADTLPHIFEPFFTTKPKEQGTGLGLATVYGIVKQSGGHISVYSEVGAGTSFKVYLPRIDGEEDIDFEDDAAVLVGGNETVLVVEDDAALRRLAAVLLSGLGYTVLTASAGGEALVVAAEHDGVVDLLLTDVIMPGMNGRVLRDILLASQPHLKVLFTSGYTDNAIVHHGVLERGTCFLPKPYQRTGLARAVRQALDGS